MKTLIKNANVVTESEIFTGDVLIGDASDGGIILDIRKGAQADEPIIPNDETHTIDASGKLLIPGAVDVHTHMDLDVGFDRAIDDFYSGTVAAACGGTTAIVDHMAFAPGDLPLMHQVEEYHRLADGNAVIDYGFHGVLQMMNEDKLREMAGISDREGITSWKAYLTYAPNMIEDEWMKKILWVANENGIVIPVHCENHNLVEGLKSKYGDEGHTEAKYHPLSRPASAEAEAVKRLLTMAREAGEAPAYVVHLSSELGLREVERARTVGQKHFGVETCTQYLALTDEMYEDNREGLKAIMSPPLRKSADIDALWSALGTGSIIDTIATDHCPFTFAKQKQRGVNDFRLCPNGAPGVEERLSVIYSEGVAKGRITAQQMVSYLCTEPAKIFGLYPRKGVIRRGSDADLVLIDTKANRIISIYDMHGKSEYN